MRCVSTSKVGITLLEVAVATVIIGILTVTGATFFTHAAKIRMNARATQAATIEANTLMEMAFRESNILMAEQSGFFDRIVEPSTGSIHLEYTTTDPSAVWSFDGVPYPLSVSVSPHGSTSNLVDIAVSVGYENAKIVNLTATRFCEK